MKMSYEVSTERERDGRKKGLLKTYTLALPLKWHHTSSITRRIITAPKHRPRISSLFTGLSEEKH